MMMLVQAMNGTEEEAKVALANVYAREEFREAGPVPVPRCLVIEERLSLLASRFPTARGQVAEAVFQEMNVLKDLQESRALV